MLTVTYLYARVPTEIRTGFHLTLVLTLHNYTTTYLIDAYLAEQEKTETLINLADSYIQL